MIFKKVKKEFKELNLSKNSIALGLVFGLMFGITLKSIALGISLGFIMMIAFNEEERRRVKK